MLCSLVPLCASDEAIRGRGDPRRMQSDKKRRRKEGGGQGKAPGERATRMHGWIKARITPVERPVWRRAGPFTSGTRTGNLLTESQGGELGFETEARGLAGRFA